MEGFLVQQIEARVKNGTRSIVYTEAEINNIFTLYDLKNSGHITKEQCREGKYYTSFKVYGSVTDIMKLGSADDPSKLRVPLHAGSGGLHPRQSRHVHFH